jgi:hypothetical protein
MKQSSVTVAASGLLRGGCHRPHAGDPVFRGVRARSASSRRPGYPAFAGYDGSVWSGVERPPRWVRACAGTIRSCARVLRRARETQTRSARLTIFWHCGRPPLSSKTAPERGFRQPTVNGFGRGSGSKGSGNADSQRYVRSSGGSGHRRACPGDSGCVRAHPAAWRASASYRPLRAVWAVCAWALRGCARSPEPFSAQQGSAPPKEFSQ